MSDKPFFTRSEARNKLWAAHWEPYFENRPEGVTRTEAMLFEVILYLNTILTTARPDNRDGDEWKT